MHRVRVMSRQAFYCAAIVAFVLVARPAGATRTIALQYDDALGREGFPNPLLSIRVGGQRAVFIVDTGAGVHTMARWFAERAGLQVTQTEHTVVGSTGQANRVGRVRRFAAVLGDGRRLSVPDAIVADFPPLFEQHEIAGLLSPQLLAESGEEAVLDLRGPALTFRRTSG